MTSDGSMRSWDNSHTQQYLVTENGLDMLKGKKKDTELGVWGRRWKELADGMIMIKNKLHEIPKKKQWKHCLK